jgi:uncharacterized protein (TIGR02246 family)
VEQISLEGLKMRNIFVVALLLLFMSTHAASQTPVAEAGTKDEEGIKMALADFVEAWNKHDAKAFSLVFAEDADFTNVRGMSVHGRAEIEKFHAPLFATRFKDTNQKIAKSKIRFIKPDVAAVDVWWEMTGAKGPEGQDIPLRKGLLNFVMTKEAGKWLILVMHNRDLPLSP